MGEISAIGLATAFAAGTASFLSPCVLPIVPGYLSYVTGDDIAQSREGAALAQRFSSTWLSLCFVLGFTTVFMILGASASALGQLLLRYSYETNLIGGSIVIVFGLAMTGALRLSWLQRDVRFQAMIGGARPTAAYVLGLAFGFGWTPCIGPVLGAILVVSAATATVSSGVVLLSAYSLGLAVPFLAAAAFMGGFLKRRTTLRRIGRPLQVAAGVIMIVMGVAMITGQLTVFAVWLIDTFPALAGIG